MPSNNPDFLMKMLHRVESGKLVKGKNGNLQIDKSDNGRFLFVYHFGTLILKVDFNQEESNKVVYQYGESQADSRYLKCILSYYNLAHFYDIGCGPTNGWKFNKVLTDDGEILVYNKRKPELQTVIENYRYKGATN
jgi:hypothetical protein